jgi:hypothetical protein
MKGGAIEREKNLAASVTLLVSAYLSFHLRKHTTRKRLYVHIKTIAIYGILKRERLGSRNVQVIIIDS